MARIRSIKPEFFLHDGLAALSPVHRLLFLGLWTLADREGRLEDRAKRVKAALFPYEDVDVDPMLWDLVEAGFIQRYEAGGSDVISIPSFLKHQRPHPKEAKSELPELPTPAALKSREKVRPSREIKRLAVEGFSSIPLAPGGREGDLGRRSQEGDLGGGGGESPNSPPPPIRYEPIESAFALRPTDPAPKARKPSAAQAFFTWSQVERTTRHRLVGELMPDPAKLNRWYSDALEALDGDNERLSGAWLRYLADGDAFLKSRKPPHPFALFMTKWRAYAPAAVSSIATEPCERPGCGRPWQFEYGNKRRLCAVDGSEALAIIGETPGEARDGWAAVDRWIAGASEGVGAA